MSCRSSSAEACVGHAARRFSALCRLLVQRPMDSSWVTGNALLESRVYDAGVDSQAQLGAVEVQVSLSCCTSDGDAS